MTDYRGAKGKVFQLSESLWGWCLAQQVTHRVLWDPAPHTWAPGSASPRRSRWVLALVWVPGRSRQPSHDSEDKPLTASTKGKPFFLSLFLSPPHPLFHSAFQIYTNNSQNQSPQRSAQQRARRGSSGTPEWPELLLSHLWVFPDVNPDAGVRTWAG